MREHSRGPLFITWQPATSTKQTSPSRSPCKSKRRLNSPNKPKTAASTNSPSPPIRALFPLSPVQWERRFILDLLYSRTGLDWNDLEQRIQSFPEVCTPVPIVRHDRLDSAPRIQLYETTILGLLCRFADTNAKLDQVLRIALCQCKMQLECSQIERGNTGFRDAAMNPMIPLRTWKEIVAAAPPNLAHQVDRDGLSPLDHVIYNIQLGTSCPQRLQVLLDCTNRLCVDTGCCSPLIRLLSTSNSVCEAPLFTLENAGLDNRQARLDRVLACSEMLLRWDPGLLLSASKLTGCTVLHLALRNFGNHLPIVQLFLDSRLIGIRNQFGDLPIHVACSVGVPIGILRLVLARAIQQKPFQTPHPLVWSVNQAGYTCVDLEWIRHIESGSGFGSPCSFYPLEPQGIVVVTNNRYDDLLRQAVEQIQLQNHVEIGGFGLLLHRILLIVRASFCDSFTRSPHDLTGNSLHIMSSLMGPHGPSLPRPILQLVWSHRPEKDHTGRLPLHWAVSLQRVNENATEKSVHEWKEWVSYLLHRFPEDCRVSDYVGRLPLHISLDFPGGDYQSSFSHQLARSEVVRKMVQIAPRSAEHADPITHLYPFQAAACNPFLTLESVYCLLRENPGVISCD